MPVRTDMYKCVMMPTNTHKCVQMSNVHRCAEMCTNVNISLNILLNMYIDQCVQTRTYAGVGAPPPAPGCPESGTRPKRVHCPPPTPALARLPHPQPLKPYNRTTLPQTGALTTPALARLVVCLNPHACQLGFSQASLALASLIHTHSSPFLVE